MQKLLKVDYNVFGTLVLYVDVHIFSACVYGGPEILHYACCFSPGGAEEGLSLQSGRL